MFQRQLKSSRIKQITRRECTLSLVALTTREKKKKQLNKAIEICIRLATEFEKITRY